MGNSERPDFEQLGALARQAQQGDGPAYEDLLKQLYTYVAMVLRARLGYIPELDDLTQICLLAMHRALPTYHPTRSFGPWVRAIIRYKVADHFRAQARRREFAQSEEVLELANRAQAVDHGEDAGVDQLNIIELLKQLPAPWAAAVRLTKMEGLSCADAAKQQGISEAALRKRVSRGYRKLADLIERERES
jgi:RNA polymerase sigma-70 factor (ECF subfamily)